MHSNETWHSSPIQTKAFMQLMWEFRPLGHWPTLLRPNIRQYSLNLSRKPSTQPIRLPGQRVNAIHSHVCCQHFIFVTNSCTGPLVVDGAPYSSIEVTELNQVWNGNEVISLHDKREKFQNWNWLQFKGFTHASLVLSAYSSRSIIITLSKYVL